MKVEGFNRYKVPHINKHGLERDGRLPTIVNSDNKLVEKVKDFYPESVGS